MILKREIDQEFPTAHITPELIHQTTKKFIGEIDQFPPVFSALKKEGKRLYEFARAGEAVKIDSRKVSITDFQITNIEGVKVDFSVTCSKGTYIRSLAYDFGKALKSGGHLSALRRTKIGEFSVDQAMSIDEFISKLN